ncbi:MAG: GntR family transcriptional regulator [Betaproteobacteria bacterium]
MIQINKQSLSTEAAHRLREMIGEGRLQPGAWLDEQRLAQAMGLSRTPLREAIRLLVSEGLIRIEPRKGCFVNSLSESDLDEIFPLMGMLEGRCAHEAAQRASPRDLEALEKLHLQLTKLAKEEKLDEYYLTNRKIHEMIQKIASNQWLSNILDELRNVLNLSRHRSLSLDGRIQASCKEHLEIFAAIKAQDSEKAAAITNRHLMNQRTALQKLNEIEEVV